MEGSSPSGTESVLHRFLGLHLLRSLHPRLLMFVAVGDTTVRLAMEPTAILIIVAIFIVAVLYSSVGHGGASGYLAVMAFLAVAPEVTRPTALVLNLFVASIGTVQFYRAGYFSWRIFLPFAATSIPMAFVGDRKSVV